MRPAWTVVSSPPFSWHDFGVVTGASALVIVALMGLVAYLARRLGRVSVVDVIWGLGFVGVAVTATLVPRFIDRTVTLAVVATGRDAAKEVDRYFEQQDLRTYLLLVLVTIWGGRLAWHIARRARGAGEDPRYEKLLADGGSIFRKVLLPQGVAIWFISLPVQVAAISYGTVGWVTWVGVAVWAIGFGFEAVGDRQLAAYKKDPDRGPVMDRGLWRYTRHPNYFGDATMWWGLWLIAADVGRPGLATVLSPVAMTYFIYFVSGVKLLERTMMQRPAFREYAERTSIFLPLPPKRR